MNKELLDKYKNKIKELNEKYLYKDKSGKIDCKDEEIYHAEFDEIITDLLDELGYTEITEQYRNYSEFFWYA